MAGAGTGPARSSTSCTSARSHRRARSTPRSSGWTTSSISASTHVELMPVNAFNGMHGWGYDGVGWYAVHEPYGGPDGLMRFVDACHAGGLAVRARRGLQPPRARRQLPAPVRPVPVVRAATRGASGQHRRPGSDEVRGYIIGNALRWLRDYRIDGLRLDAVHALRTTAAVHILEELSLEIGRAVGGALPAAVAHRRVRPQRSAADHAARGERLRAERAVGRRHPSCAARAADRRKRRATTPISARWKPWPKMLTGGFFHDGTYSSFRGRRHGRPWTGAIPGLPIPGYPAPRPGRQPRRRGPAPRSLSPGLLGGRRRLCCSRRRSPRCSSWARSGRRDAVAVLLLPPRAPARGGDGQGPHRRVRDVRLGRRRDPRSAGPPAFSRRS